MSVVDDYVAGFEGEVRTRLEELCRTLREELPGADEVISYGLATFDQGGKHVVHFGGFKNHVGFYPTPSGTETFQDQLTPYKAAKGSIQFSHDQPLPLELVRQIARFRRDEVSAALAAKSRKK